MFNQIIFRSEVLFLGTEVERTPNKNDAIGFIPTGCQAVFKISSQWCVLIRCSISDYYKKGLTVQSKLNMRNRGLRIFLIIQRSYLNSIWVSCC